jgi:hypothetical protein
MKKKYREIGVGKEKFAWRIARFDEDSQEKMIRIFKDKKPILEKWVPCRHDEAITPSMVSDIIFDDIQNKS